MMELSSSHADEEKSAFSEKPQSRQQSHRELGGSTVASEIGSGTERYEIHSPVEEMRQANTFRYELDGSHVDLDRKV